jgi:hypothetical protein
MNMKPSLETWLQLACEPNTVKRSLKVMLIVGTALILINYGGLLTSGSLQELPVLKIVLTYLVPFSVATYSSVSARIGNQKTVNIGKGYR